MKKTNNHESYGMVGFSRISCSGGVNLFGSSIKHSNIIRLRIHRASFDRDLSQEWYHAKGAIIEIDLSAAQFAQFITTPNVGDGVPCTIRNVEGKRIEEPPYYGKNEIFNDELKDKFKKVIDDMAEIVDESKEILESKGNIKAKDRKTLLGKINMFVQHVKENVPFLHKQFTRSMNKTVLEAKAEIEEFYTSAVMKVGKAALENGDIKERPKMIEVDNID